MQSTCRIRVRYVETDQMGVAHHSAYVPWLEEARIHALREAGHSYRDMEASGIGMPVVDLQVRYKRSVRFDDHLDLITTMRITGPTRVAFDTEIRHDGALCATGTVQVVAVADGSRPTRLPTELVALCQEAVTD